MAIPVSGPLSISQFNTELGRTSTQANSQLAGASTPQVGSLVYIAGQLGTLNQVAPFAFSDWYGYTQGGGGGTTTTTTTTTTTLAPTTSTTTTTTTTAGNITFIGSSQSTGTTITLPTGLQQNDIVIIASMSDGTAQNLPNTSWIDIQNGTINSVNYRWSYKRMGSTPDTTATNLSSSSVAIAFAFRGVATTAQFDVTTPSVATNTAGMPNPPSITTVTNNAMVVVVGFLDDDIITATAPTGFTLARSANYGSAGSGGTVMAAYRVKSPAGTEDAGVFGGGGDDSWVAGTLAFKPA